MKCHKTPSEKQIMANPTDGEKNFSSGWIKRFENKLLFGSPLSELAIDPLTPTVSN